MGGQITEYVFKSGLNSLTAHPLTRYAGSPLDGREHNVNTDG